MRLKSEFPIDAQSPAQTGRGRTSAPQLAFIQAIAIGEFHLVSSLSQQAPHLPASQPHFQCPSRMQFLAACGYGHMHPTLTPRLSQWVRAKRVGIDFGREVRFPGNGFGFSPVESWPSTRSTAMCRIPIIAVALVAGLLSPFSAFAQGSAGTGRTSTGIGASVGPAGPGIRSGGWTQQPGAATNNATGTANLSPSQKNSIPPPLRRR